MNGGAGPFGENANRYWAAGFSVIPNSPRTKRPLVKGWQDHRSGPPSSETQDQWLKKYPNANLGVVLGTSLGEDETFSAIDIDDDRFVPFVREVLGTWPCGKVGQKGATFFARSPADLKSRKIKPTGKAPVIEVFASSGQVVLPPSIHPKTGLAYQWIGKSLLDIDPKTLPVLDQNRLELMSLVAGSPEALIILSGEPTHEALLRLTSKGLWRFADDDVLQRILETLLPDQYSGNATDEIPELLRSARQKELGADRASSGRYEPKDVGPIPLGFTQDNRFAFRIQVTRQIDVLSAPQLITPAGLIAIAPAAFWRSQFPTVSHGQVTGFDPRAAADALIGLAHAKGPFDPARIRGRGIWREDDRIIENLSGEPPRDTKFEYQCFAALPALTSPLNHRARMQVNELLEAFCWKTPGAARLLLGWTFIAPVCGALSWRPHIFVYGPKNGGKTTLMRLIGELLNPLAIMVDGQSTEAGIRQLIGPDSRPVVMDEFESDQDRSRMRRIIKLMRSASSVEGAVVRGTPEGHALQFSIRTTFCLAAINPTVVTPADRSRIVQLELGAHDNNPAAHSNIQEGLKALRGVGPSWCRHAINALPKLDDTISVFERAMPPGDSRHITNIATLLAGAWLTLNDQIPSAQDAESGVAEIRTLIDQQAREHDADDAFDCLNHLLGWSDGHQTVGGYLGLATDQEPGSRIGPDAEVKLGTFGVRLWGDGFIVANQHAGLDRAFKDTRWTDQAWRTALRRIPGATALEDPTRIGGAKVRCTVIPGEHMPDPLPPGPPGYPNTDF